MPAELTGPWIVRFAGLTRKRLTVKQKNVVRWVAT